MQLKSLIFATNNEHKANEIRHILGDKFIIKTLRDSGIDIDIPEPHATLEENAREKSSVIHRLTGGDCFSEDTGLEVTILNGAPGVKSARYAGDEANFENNIIKLLKELDGISERQAQFRTVISLVLDNREYQFEGICPGKIIEAKRGSQGFGYDPVFVPEGADKTFAEMTIGEKTMYSHRKKATEKFIAFLNNYNVKN